MALGGMLSVITHLDCGICSVCVVALNGVCPLVAVNMPVQDGIHTVFEKQIRKPVAHRFLFFSVETARVQRAMHNSNHPRVDRPVDSGKVGFHKRTLDCVVLVCVAPRFSLRVEEEKMHRTHRLPGVDPAASKRHMKACVHERVLPSVRSNTKLPNTHITQAHHPSTSAQRQTKTGRRMTVGQVPLDLHRP